MESNDIVRAEDEPNTESDDSDKESSKSLSPTNECERKSTPMDHIKSNDPLAGQLPRNVITHVNHPPNADLVAATFIDSPKDSPTTIHKSNIHLYATRSGGAMDHVVDYSCKNVKLTEQVAGSGNFLQSAKVTWDLPKSGTSDKSYILVNVREDLESTWSSGHLWHQQESLRISKGKLKCGIKYHVTVEYHVWIDQHNRYEKHPSTEKVFMTRPSKATNIRVELMDTKVVVKWSICEDAERYSVSISSRTGDQNVVMKRNNLSHAKLEFDIAENDDMFFGNYYNFQVTSWKGDRFTPSEKVEHFIGNEFCPRSVTVERKEGKDKDIFLKWECPSNTENLKNYVVEALSADNNIWKRESDTEKYKIPHQDLQAGMTYTFRVAAMHEKLSGFTYTHALTTDPTNIQVREFCATKNEDYPDSVIECTWETAGEASMYEVRCRSKHQYTSIEVVENKLTLTRLMPNMEYEIAVRAKDHTGYGPYTKEKSLTTDCSSVTEASIRTVEEEKNAVIVTFNEAIGETSHKVKLRHAGDDSKVEPSKSLHRCQEVIPRLSMNAKYEAVVTSMFNGKEGKAVITNTVWIVPAKLTTKEIEYRLEQKYPTYKFILQLKPKSRCPKYEVKITCTCNHRQIKESKTLLCHGESEIDWQCEHEGCICSVTIRGRNKGGHGEWSDPLTVATAPARVESVEIFLNDEEINTKWSKSENAKTYRVEIYDGDRSAGSENGKEQQFHNFSCFKPVYGSIYICKVYPININNKSGPASESEPLFMPLDAPTAVTYSSERNSDRFIFSWKKSKGMESAFILLKNSKSEKTTATATEEFWRTPPLCAGEYYEYKIWAKNEKAESKIFVCGSFPTRPSDIVLKRNALKPETCLDVEVVTKYAGPFLLTWRDPNKKNTTTSVAILKRYFTIEHLHPATEYTVDAACLHGENLQHLGAKCHSGEIMTLPSQVSGVSCRQARDSDAKILSWEGCGNERVQYTISWSRNNSFFEPLTTYGTEYSLSQLEPGGYAFSASAGGGRKSDPYCITVPGRPSFTVKVITPSIVKIVSSTVPFATEYKLQLQDEDETPYLLFTSKDGYFWIKHNFEEGRQYQAMLWASCNGIFGAAATSFFRTALKVSDHWECILDEKSPTTTVDCKWTNTEHMNQAKIELSSPDGESLQTAVTVESHWIFRELTPNQRYVVKLYPGDGQKFFESHATNEFNTAPLAPDRVDCAGNKDDPQTSLDITIHSTYAGPFLTQVKNEIGKVVTQYDGDDKSFTISGLEPGKHYFIYSRCVFGPHVSEWTACRSVQE